MFPHGSTKPEPNANRGQESLALAATTPTMKPLTETYIQKGHTLEAFLALLISGDHDGANGQNGSGRDLADP